MDKEKAEEVAEWLKCCVDDCCGKCSKCSAFVEESLGECALIRTYEYLREIAEVEKEK